MHGSVALRAEANEILFRIFALVAPTLNVMDLETRNRPAVLTSPAVSLQDLPAQRAVGIGTQPNPAGYRNPVDDGRCRPQGGAAMMGNCEVGVG